MTSRRAFLQGSAAIAAISTLPIAAQAKPPGGGHLPDHMYDQMFNFYGHHEDWMEEPWVRELLEHIRPDLPTDEINLRTNEINEILRQLYSKAGKALVEDTNVGEIIGKHLGISPT